jgi:peptide/nickel transport system substrate-binding protein
MMKRTFRAVAAGTATILAAAFLAGCSSTEADDGAAAPTSLTIAHIGDTPYNFDTTAGIGTWANPAMEAVYDVLVAWNQDFNGFDPWLATEWTYLNDDQTQMEMKLRDDVTFIDGAEFNAEAVKASYDAMLTRNASPTSVQMNTYGTEITVLDEFTIQIDTTRAMQSDFFQNLAIVPIASPDALADPDALSTTPIGSGPYILDPSSTLGVEMKFTRNDDYWNKEAFPFDTLVVKQFADRVAALNALRSGQVDAAAIDIAAAAEAESAGFELTLGYGTYRTLTFGDRDGKVLPAIGDVRVRKAINMAFDREAISASLDLGYGKVVNQAFTTGMAEYIEGGDDYYTYDPAAAKALLAEAGYPDGFDLTIPTSSATTPMEPIVKQSLEDIGIRVTYKPFPEPALLLQEAQSGQYPVILSTQYYVSTVPEFMIPGGAWATTWGYQNDTIDDLIEVQRYGTPEEAKEASQELGQYVLDEAWFAPFSSPPAVWAAKPGLDVKLGSITGSIRLPYFTPAS